MTATHRYVSISGKIGEKTSSVFRLLAGGVVSCCRRTMEGGGYAHAHQSSEALRLDHAHSRTSLLTQSTTAPAHEITHSLTHRHACTSAAPSDCSI